jgi:fimbrial chaperone protein
VQNITVGADLTAPALVFAVYRGKSFLQLVFRGVVWAALLLGFLAIQVPHAAFAANFEFNPPTIELAAGDRVATITLTNFADTPLRLEVAGFRWEQQPDGQMQLDDTSDLVIFPQLLTFAPHETRRIRVVVNVPPGELEKTYRVQITEIPAPGEPSPLEPSIRMLSQLRLPIFLAPLASRVAGNITNAAVHHGLLTFSIANSGTAHFTTKNLTVTAHGAGGTPAFKKNLDGWYVLAGGHRDYSVALPHCETVGTVTIEADAGTHVSQAIEVPPDSCRP